MFHFKPLSANPTRWSNNMQKNYLSVFDHFVVLTLKGLNAVNRYDRKMWRLKFCYTKYFSDKISSSMTAETSYK